LHGAPVPIHEGKSILFQGETIQLSRLAEGFVELAFNRANAAINKLDRRTIDEWRTCTALIAADDAVRGVLVTSGKDVFIVGADINEFGTTFKLPAGEISADTARSNEVANAFEDLGVPSVAAINGVALGGGFEIALCAAYRVMSTAAQVGLPEVKLGLFPGLGGTVRMTRIAGPALAVDWITLGKTHKAAIALEAGVVDAVSAPDALRETALAWLREAAAAQIDWRTAQARKGQPVPITPVALAGIFDMARVEAAASFARHEPAASIAVEMMACAALHDRAAALNLEAHSFGEVAKTQAATSLIQTFHNEQALRKLTRQATHHAHKVQHCAVVGAGSMGGSIAAISAVNGVAVVLKDICARQLDVGNAIVAAEGAQQFRRGCLATVHADKIKAAIHGQLDYQGFERADLVIEAVVGNLQSKRATLHELEGVVGSDAIIATTTSSLSIDAMAQELLRPENFIGMHFFRPVPLSRLVEVIKGHHTSNAAIATAVGHVVSMGKTPVVVKDCPGFLVNRILTSYIRAFLQLVADGADFARIDQVMEDFGWPMGPASIADIMGVDNASHLINVISSGYAERMSLISHDALRLLTAHQRLGQKNGIGFYRYESDDLGKLHKSAAADTHALLTFVHAGGQREFADQEITDRLMLPLMIEAAHALEDGVVGTPAELDMALLLGLGFPKYLGGPLTYADWLGMPALLERCAHYGHLGAAYRATEGMRAMAAGGRRYYPNN
jgi:3-hydroxyacyl-CoA dehydrogenase/enoyl-CoA hydratase/3-hydroxybutyryl-CoA epimerase/enoyl-CoA isomerase